MGLGLVALVLGTSACSSTDSGSVPDTTAITGSEPGGTLRIGAVGFDPITAFDPLLVAPTNQSAMIALDLTTDSLTEWPGDIGSTEAAVPSIATSVTPDPTFTVWTVVLDPDRTFSDGSTVTAEDVRFSLDRAKAASSTLAGARLDVVSAVGVVDPATVRITTTGPFVQLPELLASPLYGIVSRAAAEAPTGGRLVGSGPYGFVTGDDTTVGLVRVTGPAADGAGPDRVELRRYGTIAESFAALGAGDLDWSLAPVDASLTTGEVVVAPSGAAGWLGIDVGDPTFSDIRFRQAIAQAIDRDAVVAAALPGCLASSTLVVTGVPGRSADPCGESCHHDFNPGSSRALLATVFPDGTIPTVVLDTFDEAGQRRVLDEVQADLEAVGIPVEQHIVAPEEYDAFVVSGGQGVFSLGTVGIIPIQDSYVGSSFVSTSGDNATGLRSATLDAQIAQARGTTDAGERESRYRAIEQQVLSQYVQIPLFQLQAHQAVSEQVRGFTPRLDGTFVLADLSLVGP